MIFFLAVANAYPAAASGQAKAKEEGGSTGAGTACLKCHGPFERLASAPPSFVAPGGEKITPHRYVPHNGKDIPDCVACHRPHPANPTADELAALPKPGVKFCFECHHTETFASCKDCHKRG